MKTKTHPIKKIITAFVVLVSIGSITAANDPAPGDLAKFKTDLESLVGELNSASAKVAGVVDLDAGQQLCKLGANMVKLGQSSNLAADLSTFVNSPTGAFSFAQNRTDFQGALPGAASGNPLDFGIVGKLMTDLDALIKKDLADPAKADI